MKNFIVYLIIILALTAGCSSSKQFPIEETMWNEEAPFTMEDIQNQTREEIVLGILEPLFEAATLETLMLQGSAYKEGMTISDLKEWMLQYYTSDLVIETCDLITYKSQFTFNMYHSGKFSYDESSDEFSYTIPVGIGPCTSLFSPLNENEYVLNSEIKIVDIHEFTEDRIILEVALSWIDSPTISDETCKLVLEREGSNWYFGELITSRYLMAKANVDYTNY